jgi:hypothetical protein
MNRDFSSFRQNQNLPTREAGGNPGSLSSIICIFGIVFVGCAGDSPSGNPPKRTYNFEGPRESILRTHAESMPREYLLGAKEELDPVWVQRIFGNRKIQSMELITSRPYVYKLIFEEFQDPAYLEDLILGHKKLEYIEPNYIYRTQSGEKPD